MIYDLVIVGGGPSGLALAHCCKNIPNTKILIIERENQIGGCHRVNRVDYKNEKLFTEHGPRIYSSIYVNFIFLLNEMGVSFDDLFVLSKFQAMNMLKKLVVFDLSNIYNVMISYLYLLLDDNYGRHTNLATFVKKYNFTEKQIETLNRICLLSDGGDINKYSLNEFLQLINQQAMFKIYQPRYENDTRLFKIWKNFLEKDMNNGSTVEFMLNSEITKINMNDNLISSCVVNNKKIEGNKFIFAMPPRNLLKIFENSENKLLLNSYGNYNVFKKWVRDSSYIEYISVVFHWDKKYEINKSGGFPTSYWGVVFITLNEYIDFKEKQSKTVISTAVTITDKKSKNNNKTANECTKEEIIKEMFIQLKEIFPFLPEPSAAIMTPNNYYDNNDKTWKSKDSAYLAAYNVDHINFKSNVIDNLYSLGTHNGKSFYKFTSMESAITNAIYLARILYPDLKKKYKILTFTTLRDVLYYILIIIIILLIIFNILYVYNNIKK
jgi:protoporphyrinogen oxidase